MIAPDVNVLLYALREDCDRHVEFRDWLQSALNGTEPVALFEPVLASVMRIATHPAIFRPPTPRPVVEAFIDACLSAPVALALRAETSHWSMGTASRDSIEADTSLDASRRCPDPSGNSSRFTQMLRRLVAPTV